jgi:hypothetical protein
VIGFGLQRHNVRPTLMTLRQVSLRLGYEVDRHLPERAFLSCRIHTVT